MKMGWLLSLVGGKFVERYPVTVELGCYYSEVKGGKW